MPLGVSAAVAIFALWLGVVVLKVRVVACCLGRDSAGRIVDEHGFKKLETDVVEVLAEWYVVVAYPLGEGCLEVGIGGDAGPDVLSRGSKQTIGGKEVSMKD